jgi:NTP pyrophosphatase (non-canonical NTP hydrolase)
MMNLDTLAIMLDELQKEHRKWVEYNFPNQPKYHGLLGLTEEVGELAHAFLKQEQGIRHQNYKDNMVDAVGDIVIFLTSFCNANHINLGCAVCSTWEKVRTRDWIKYPKDGKTE